MQSPPCDKGPLRPVPQAAQQHDGHQVDVGAHRAFAIAAEGDVEVIAQKAAEGHVPAAPEFREAGRFVGGVEVLAEMKAEQTRQADGHVGVGGEIKVDLKGVSQ